MKINRCLGAIKGCHLPGGLQELPVGFQQDGRSSLDLLGPHLHNQGVIGQHTQRGHKAWNQEGLEGLHPFGGNTFCHLGE